VALLKSYSLHCRALEQLTTFPAPHSLADVLRLLWRALLVVVLSMAIGLHWLVLQSVAWTTMVVKYSKQQSLGVAICQTFDGDHPCSLCHVVNKAKNSEKKSDVQSASQKIDLICLAQRLRLIAPFGRINYQPHNVFAYQTGDSPPVPPPRFILS
jgi:hypothetical protein